MENLDWEAMELFHWFYSNLSGPRGGGFAGAEAKNFWSWSSSLVVEIRPRAIVGSAKLCWVVDLWREFHSEYSDHWPLSYFARRWVNVIQASLNSWMESGRPRLLYSIWKSYKDKKCLSPPEEEPSEASITSYAVVVSAVLLLSLVYQYLTGTVDLGCSKAYSRSSLDFRDIFVAVVLFLGAYVWIKFREVALRGVHKRTRVDKQGRTKVMYDARLTPPRWNGKAVPKLELGQFATEQEAHNKFHIAAFYYNRDAGLLDGWFQVPPMSEEERSLTGLELRTWVIGQAKKVYEDFRRKEAALLLQELLEDEVTLEQDEVTVDFSVTSLLNPHEDREPALVSQVENLGMDMAIPDDQGLECATQTFGGMHEGFVTSAGHSLGFEEESLIPIPQLTADAQSGMGINNSNQLNLLQVVHNQQELITYLQQQLEESRIRISELEDQHSLQQQLQVINEGVSSFEVEMQLSMHPQNHPCRPQGSVFW